MVVASRVLRVIIGRGRRVVILVGLREGGEGMMGGFCVYL